MNDILINSTKIVTKPKRVSPRKGRWSGEEKLKFKQGLAQYGKNWKKIQSYVKSRSLLQIRSHAQKHFIMQKKLEKRNKRWKKTVCKQQIVEKSSSKIQFISNDFNESLDGIDFTQKPTDCPNFTSIYSNELLNGPYTLGSLPVYEYPMNFNQVPFSNIYSNMGVSNPIIQAPPNLPCPITMPIPMQMPVSMQIPMQIRVPVQVPMMTVGMNPCLPQSVGLQYLPINNFQGRYIY